jgi:hypothetical protein
VLEWVFKFLICAFCGFVVVYVAKLGLDMLFLPEPANRIAYLILAVGVLIVACRYLGAPPSGGEPKV